jgi:hypothetical protein
VPIELGSMCRLYIRDYVLLMLSQKCGDQLIFSAKRFLQRKKPET